jgi:hypothetical protein
LSVDSAITTYCRGVLGLSLASRSHPNLLARVVEDEESKMGTFFDVRVKRLRENKVRLFLSLQKNEPEKVNVSEIRLLGNSVQTVQDIELRKPAKIVFQKDARDSAQLSLGLPLFGGLVMADAVVHSCACPAPTATAGRIIPTDNCTTRSTPG